MSTALAEALSAVLLVVVLACAVMRPFGWLEGVVAVPAAGVVIATGAISLDHTAAEAARLGPVIGFLAAVLVLAQLCDDEGLFHACGAWMARTAEGRPRRLVVQVFALASVITAVLRLPSEIGMSIPSERHARASDLHVRRWRRLTVKEAETAGFAVNPVDWMTADTPAGGGWAEGHPVLLKSSSIR